MENRGPRNLVLSLPLVLALALALAGCAEGGPEPDFGPGVDLPGDGDGDGDGDEGGTGGGSGSGGGTSAGEDSDGGGDSEGGSSGGLDEDGDGCISPHEIELPVVFPEEARRTDPTGYREYGPEDHWGEDLLVHCPPCPPPVQGGRCLTEDWFCGCLFDVGKPQGQCYELGLYPAADGPTPYEAQNTYACVPWEPCPVEYVHCDPSPDSGELCGPEDLYPGDAYPCQPHQGDLSDETPWAACWGYCY